MALIWILWASSAPLYWHVMRKMLCELNIFPCFFFKDIFLTGHTSIRSFLCMFVVVKSIRSCDGR